MSETKYRLKKIIIDDLAPYFTTGSFTYQDPQQVADGESVMLTNGSFVSGGEKLTIGKLKLSLANVGGNIIIVKQLKKKTKYNTLKAYVKDNAGNTFEYLFSIVLRKTALENAIGIEDAVSTDIEFEYGQDVVIS